MIKPELPFFDGVLQGVSRGSPRGLPLGSEFEMTFGPRVFKQRHCGPILVLAVETSEEGAESTYGSATYS